MNDENLRLTGSANSDSTNIATTGSVFGTPIPYGKNRGGVAALRVGGIVVGSTGSCAITLQQATSSTTASASWFDIAILPPILADGLATQGGADPTGVQMGVETSAFTAKPEIPGAQPPTVAFLTSMDFLRAKIVTTGVTTTYTGVSVTIVPNQDSYKRSGVAWGLS